MPPGEAEFHVVYSEAIRQALSAHIDALLKAGWAEKAVRTLVQTMDGRLKHGPRDFGEPLYTLHTKNIRVSIGFVRPFAIQFGVHEDSMSVFVRKIILMNPDQGS